MVVFQLHIFNHVTIFAFPFFVYTFPWCSLTTPLLALSFSYLPDRRKKESEIRKKDKKKKKYFKLPDDSEKNNICVSDECQVQGVLQGPYECHSHSANEF